jgi:biopolymer transport protein ExbD
VATNPSRGPVAEVDLTPLIDVSLVLVVMLLLATPLAVESSFALKRTEAAAQEAEEKDVPERVELDIRADGTVLVNRETTALADLESVLRPMLADEAPPSVVVTCMDAVPHGDFVRVVDTAKQCGATEIAFTPEAAR